MLLHWGRNGKIDVHMHAISRGEKRNERVGKQNDHAAVAGDQTTAVGPAREFRRGLQPSGGEGRITAGLLLVPFSTSHTPSAV